jgi:hypothetical protein
MLTVHGSSVADWHDIMVVSRFGQHHVDVSEET